MVRGRQYCHRTGLEGGKGLSLDITPKERISAPLCKGDSREDEWWEERGELYFHEHSSGKRHEQLR